MGGHGEEYQKTSSEDQLDPSKIGGISFCSQFQTVVMVDENGKPLRRAITMRRFSRR